jgi:LPS-assembly lipoprotein
MKRASAIVALIFTLAVAGCGYRPLYGSASDSAGVTAMMASVAIPPADSRLAQLIRNDLVSSMRGSSDERYTLVLKPALKKNAIIEKPQPSVTRQSVHVTVSYDLIEQKSGTTVHSGKTFSQASYDLVRQPFADMQAETNATERAAHEVAADIRTRIAAYFASQTQSP